VSKRPARPNRAPAKPSLDDDPAPAKPSLDDDPVGLELQRTFGSNLRAARIRAGLTQEELATKAGSARTYVWAIEDGRTNLTFGLAAKFATAIGTTVVNLLVTPDQSTVQDDAPVATSGVAPTRAGTLAIELPVGQAFEIALAASRALHRPVQLIEPLTREIKGTASE
jgi:transcriptional regulator with XRE-family HTH domain